MRWGLIWVLNACALLAVAYWVPGIHVAGFMAALIAALIIGLLNMLIRPLLVLLTLPMTVLTLGLFIFVINGLLFYLAAYWLEGFEVQTFVAGIVGALLYSLLSGFFSALLPNHQ